MSISVGKEVAAMRSMTVSELRERHAEVFGEATTSRHKEHLVRRIAWRMQAKEEGGISERARRRAGELAAGADVRLSAPKRNDSPPAGRTKVVPIGLAHDGRLPMPGAVVTREYKGRTVEVHVLPEGFEYQGEVYRTLSAVAKAVTGAHWNGYHFFGLGRRDADDKA